MSNWDYYYAETVGYRDKRAQISEIGTAHR